MNVLVVGANGQIGEHLVDLLKDEGKHQPIAFVRKEEQVKKFENKGVEARLGDLEDSIDEIKERMTDVDAVVFTAGSGGSTGADKTLLIDLDGAVKVMEAAQNIGVKRFLIVSALGADNRERWNEEIKSYYVAKHFADMWLMDSDLDYTIIRPGMLENEKTKETVLIKEMVERADHYSIPRVDVARVISASLDNDHTINKAFDVVSGEQTIEEALNSL